MGVDILHKRAQFLKQKLYFCGSARSVFIPPLPGGDAVYIFERSGEMQLVGIADCISDVAHGQIREL